MNRLCHVNWIAIILLFCVFPANAEGLAVEITSPEDGTTYSAGATINISLTASITSGTIEKVALYQNDWLLSDTTDVAYPNYIWQNVPAGNYVLTAKVVDDLDNEVISEPVTIRVGGILKYDKALNGEFTPTGNNPPWPWIFDRYEEAQATFELDDGGLSDDGSSAYITFQDIADKPFWCVQLMQRFHLQAGHKYEVNFTAWALKEKPIQVTFSMDYDPWDTHWWEDITLSDEIEEYGPYTYECTLDDPLVMMKFILSMDDTELYIDNVRILDIHPSTEVGDALERLVNQYSLHQNYPNPFNPTTNIAFALAKTGFIELAVYNLLGEKVAILTSGMHTAGSHTVQWNATGNPAGIYFYKLTAPGEITETKKLILLK